MFDDVEEPTVEMSQRSLKTSRKVAKASVTRKINEITSLMCAVENVNVVIAIESELDEAMEKFYRAHDDYHRSLTTAEAQEESVSYFTEQVRRYLDFKERIHLFRRRCERTSLPAFDSVQPSDSISQIGSKVREERVHPSQTSSVTGRSRVSSCSRSSRASSVLSERVKLAAERAAMVAEVSLLQESGSLAQERLRLEHQEKLLKLRTEIAKTEAKARVYEEFNAVEEEVPDHPRNFTPLPHVEPREEKVSKPLNPGAKPWCPDYRIVDQRSSGVHDARGPQSTGVEMLEAINKMQLQVEQQIKTQKLPKTEIMSFDGNPLNYYLFMKTFENSVEKCTEDDSMRLQLLIQYCTGKAKETIKCCGMMSGKDGYAKAKKLLEERFGEKYVVSNAWIEKLSEGPPINLNDREALLDLADDLESCEIALTVAGRLNQINNEDKMIRILRRVPPYLRSRWQKRVQEIRAAGRDPNLEDLKKMIRGAAKEKNDPVFGSILDPAKDARNKEKSRNKPPLPKKTDSFAGSTTFPDSSVQVDRRESQPNSPSESSSSRLNARFKCFLCNGGHKLEKCERFSAKSSEEKLKFVRDRKLCENCLSYTHFATGCKSPRACGVDQCSITRKHLGSLHDALLASFRRRQEENRELGPSVGSSSNLTQPQSEHVVMKSSISIAGGSHEYKALPIVPVKVKGRGSGEIITTYALLDNGSTSTWCSESLAKKLGVVGPRIQVSLSTIEKDCNPTSCHRVCLEIMDMNEINMIELPEVLTKEKLNISTDGVACQDDVNRWSHLSGIQVPERVNAEVELLIGQDVPEALEPSEIRTRRGNGPYATKTKFGWTLNGPLGRHGRSDVRDVNFVRADEVLSQQFHHFMNFEFSESISEAVSTMSRQDKQALNTYEDSARLVDGHYEIAIPWKCHPPDLPNNKPLAEHRLNLLRKKLLKDPELYSRYSAFMTDLLDKGYAKKVPENLRDRNDGKVWYLPHHSVVHPQKPDKVRVVFDCAATYRGTSLNAQVLQGPDLTNKVVGVLLRFREEPVALMADVEAMYHQLKVHPDDVDALRFLWYPDCDLTREPEEYHMAVHLFGGVWSASCANYGLQRTAKDNSDDFDPEVARSVERNFYVDDYLKSVESQEKAISSVHQLRNLLARGGFNLTKWVSNSRAVLKTIPRQHRASGVRYLDLGNEILPVERALGVRWNVETDEFVFKTQLKNKPPTRRGLLSVVSSVYDPLGFISPFLLSAKIILQDLCRRKLKWDDVIPRDCLHQTQLWLESLPAMEQFSVQRCYKPKEFGTIADLQIHHFSDASEVGYGAVSYLRFTDADSKVHCSFVMSKTRLAPLKSLSVPRLELTAATLAVKLDKMLRKELELPINRSMFWTDSTSVLRYIENEDKRFHTFVSNRLTVIHDGSTPDQWRYVDSKRNPSDAASRGLSAKALLESDSWRSGPDFLWQDESSWPTPPARQENISDGDLEIKREVRVHAVELDKSMETVEKLLCYFSSWDKLRKSVAYILRFKSWLLNKMRRKLGQAKCQCSPMKGRVTVDEMKIAEQEVLRVVQKKAFPKEVKQLTEASLSGSAMTKSVNKSSSIRNLDPFMEDDLLRVGGRLRHASIEAEARNPIILPKKAHVVDHLVRHYHAKAGHSGREHVLSLIREKYWIIKGRMAVRRVLSSCFDCKRRQQPPGSQKMSDLPHERVTPAEPPFTFVGVDYFGPFYVKRGRCMEKRYGVLFTCLTVRAVHIEVAHSLDTSSFINALRRFIARRGSPRVIRSDNGTNLTSGEKELREAIGGWNESKIGEFLLQKEVRWVFNLPAASHMGGIWERMIRSVRKVLNALLKNQSPNDEGLSTLMCEVEAILNSRPLTKVSDDPNDLQALSPNHLLLLRAGPECPPGIFAKNDQFSQKRWKQVQYLSDMFWKRWTKEYLPSLQKRMKWSEFRRNVNAGDLVLVVDDSTPRCSWPLGRVLEIYPNKDDGLVRVAQVKTKSGTFLRPITKLCVLECAQN